MSNFSRFSRIALIAAVGVLMTMPLYGVNKTWTGGGLTNNWSDPNNWSPTGPPVQFDALFFAGSLRTNNFNDINNTSFLGLTFNAGAAAFTLNGDTIFLGNGTGGTGNILNSSTLAQRVNFTVPDVGFTQYQGLYLNNSQTFNAANGDLLISATNLGTNFFFAGASTVVLTITGAHNTNISSNITDDPTFGAVTPLQIVKEGTGHLVLGGANNTYTGGVIINNGTVEVASPSGLGLGSTTIAGLPVPQFGILKTFGPGPLSFFVGQNFTILGGTPFNILEMKVGGTIPSLTADHMTVGGSAFLSGELFVRRINNYMPLPGDEVEIIRTVGTRNGTFQFVTSDFPGLVRPIAVYFPQSVDVRFVLIATFLSQGVTFNQQQVGNAIDLAFASACLTAAQRAQLGSIPIGFLPAAFDLIAPEEFGAMYEMSFSRNVIQNSNLQHRMDQVRANADPNCGPIVEVAPEGKDKNMTMPPAPAPAARFDTFATGSGQYVAVHDQDANAQGYRITNGSFLAGADYSFLRMFAIGVYGGYVGSEANLVNNGEVISDGGTVGAYATFFTHGFYIQGAGGGGWNTFQNRRGALGFGPFPAGRILRAAATSSTDGSEFNAMGAIGYDWNHTFVFANHPGTFTAGPIFTVQYTDVDIDEFTEHGSLVPLHFDDQSQDSTRFTVGGKLALCVQTDHGIMFKPDVRVAYFHESNRTYDIDANFIGCPDIFTVLSPRIGADAVEVNAGLTVQFNPMVSLFAHYDGQFGRDNYHAQGVTGGLGLSF